MTYAEKKARYAETIAAYEATPERRAARRAHERRRAARKALQRKAHRASGRGRLLHLRSRACARLAGAKSEAARANLVARMAELDAQIDALE